jgi:hypothetical protein
MNFKYNIIKDEYNFTDAWDKFSQTISDAWDWDNDLSHDNYSKYFDQCMIKEGMTPSVHMKNGSVFFKKESFLTLFLLKWS